MCIEQLTDIWAMFMVYPRITGTSIYDFLRSISIFHKVPFDHVLRYLQLHGWFLLSQWIYISTYKKNCSTQSELERFFYNTLKIIKIGLKTCYTIHT